MSFFAVSSNRLGQTPPPAHVHVEIADMSFTRSDTVGEVLRASDIIVVSNKTRAHDDFLLTCGTVTKNVVTWSSASGATAVVLLGRKFAVSSCSGTLYHLPLSAVVSSLRPCHLCPCPCSSAALAKNCCQRTVVFQFTVVVLLQMRQALTHPSSILSHFTFVMMSSITVFDDLLSCARPSSSCVVMSS